jgi:hypothetical protein
LGYSAAISTGIGSQVQRPLATVIVGGILLGPINASPGGASVKSSGAGAREWKRAAGLTCVIALVDWYTRPFISIGFLHLFPMMLIGGVLKCWQIVAASVACAILKELYSNLPLDNAVPRLVFSWFGFAGTGLFLIELLRDRRIVLVHLDEVETQSRQRKEAEEQVQLAGSQSKGMCRCSTLPCSRDNPVSTGPRFSAARNAPTEKWPLMRRTGLTVVLCSCRCEAHQPLAIINILPYTISKS